MRRDCELSDLLEEDWIPVFTGMTEEDFETDGRSATVSEDVSLMNSPLTKSPTGERMEEKILPVCLGMFPIEEMIDW
ncbi:MAG: hypothetical protein HW401_263 [Parcubacteria group bacterium]|nr:hypothetical protein [Parcubacteria group bacterium]